MHFTHFFFIFWIHRHTTTVLLNIQRKVSARSLILNCIVEKLQQRLQQFFGFVFPLFTLHELLSNVFPLLWICFTPQATTVKAVAETQLIAHTHTHTYKVVQPKKALLKLTPHSLLKRAPIDFPLLNLNTLCPARCWQTNWHELCSLASQVEYFSGPTLNID